VTRAGRYESNNWHRPSGGLEAALTRASLEQSLKAEREGIRPAISLPRLRFLEREPPAWVAD